MRKRARKRRRELLARIEKLDERKREASLEAKRTSVLNIPLDTWDKGTDAVLDYVKNSDLKPVGSGFLVVPQTCDTGGEWAQRVAARKQQRRKLVM
jgi:hypothetical protein